MAKTIEQLKAQSAEVKNASVIGENTATRVGSLFNDIVEHVEAYEAGQAQKDTEQSTSINAETSRAMAAETTLSERINQEVTDRKAMDEIIATQLSNEIERAKDMELGISTKLNDEIKRATEAENNLQEQITSEAEARDLAINGEAQARVQNDQLLSQAIATEQERAEAAEQANAQSIDAAVTKNEEQDQKLSELEDELTIKVEGFDWKVGYVADNGQVSISPSYPNSSICLEPKIYTEEKEYTIPDGMILTVKKGSSPTSLSIVAQGTSQTFSMITKDDSQYTSYALKYENLSDISPSEGINAASRTKRLDDIDNRLGGLSAELNDLKAISTYQEEYVLDNAISQLSDYSVSSSGIIESYASYNIKLYKLEANKKYLLRRKVEWSGIYLGYVAQFDIDNFVAGGSATSVILGSTNITEKEITYASDTYISILSKEDMGTFYEIVGFNDKGVVDVKQDLESIITDLESIENVVRKSIVIKRTDDNIQLYDKLLTAYNAGNTDVFFETSVYELTFVYTYMKDTLGYTSMYEMQIGNGCRYFLNGSTLISKHIDGIPDNDRSVFGTRMKSSDYEIYDGILITDGGHYVVHDDTQNYNKQYRHVYKNITFKTTNDEGVRNPEAPLGCGTGKYVDTIFEDCIFDSFGDTDFFCHGIINDTHQKVTLRLTFSNCFFSKFVGLSGYLTNEDDIKLVVNNCSLGRTDTIQHENKCKYLHMYNNQVRD